MRYKFPLKMKLALALFSLLLSLLALEIGLRAAGQYYLSNTITPPSEIDPAPDNVRIMSIGDSFTFGGRVPRHETYPAHLGRLLREKYPNWKHQVFNQGVCEYNSAQVLMFLSQWLELYKPQVVVLLVGSSNRFNSWGFEGGGGQGILNTLRGLRVYKMLRLIVLNLSARDGSGDAVTIGADGHFKGKTLYIKGKDYIKKMQGIKAPSSGDRLRHAWYLHNSGDPSRAKDEIRRALEERPKDLELLAAAGYFLFKEKDIPGADPYYRKILQSGDKGGLALGQLAWFFNNAGRESIKPGTYDKAIDYLFEALTYNPHDEYVYYAMNRAYNLQSRYDARTMLRKCEALLRAHPDLADNPKFKNHVQMFKAGKEWDRTMVGWLESDLEKIVKMVKESGARLILQNYPVSYPLANNTLQKVAKEHALPLVDNLSVFNGLLTSRDRKELLHDDDHCTPAGHGVMAQNVMRTLVQQKITPR